MIKRTSRSKRPETCEKPSLETEGKTPGKHEEGGATASVDGSTHSPPGPVSPAPPTWLLGLPGTERCSRTPPDRPDPPEHCQEPAAHELKRRKGPDDQEPQRKEEPGPRGLDAAKLPGLPASSLPTFYYVHFPHMDRLALRCLGYKHPTRRVPSAHVEGFPPECDVVLRKGWNRLPAPIRPRSVRGAKMFLPRPPDCSEPTVSLQTLRPDEQPTKDPRPVFPNLDSAVRVALPHSHTPDASEI